MKLEVFNLSTEEDFQIYRTVSRQIDKTNPFSKIELLLTDCNEDNTTKYFLLTKQGEPKIIMVFNLKKIKIGKQITPYFDVVSPYGYSGPIMVENTPMEKINLFWEIIDNWYLQNNVITEFIRFSLNKNHLYYNGTTLPTLNNVKVEIIDAKEQWEKFDKKVRNNYRKAEQFNLTFKIYHQNIQDNTIEDFYKIYNSTMDRKNADTHLYYSFEYFKKYINNNPSHCAIAMVFINEIPISTEFILIATESIYSYLGGTNSDFFNMRPNDYLKVNVLDWARKMNFKYYVLGGGRSNDDSLYNYKKSFYPKEKDVVYYTGRKIVNENVYRNLILNQSEKEDLNYNIENDLSGRFFPKYRTP